MDPDPIRSLDPNNEGNTIVRAMAFTGICQQFFVRTILALIFNNAPPPPTPNPRDYPFTASPD